MSETISAFTLQSDTDITTLFLGGYDPSKAAGDRNRRISASGMLAAYMAAFTASLEGSGGTFSNHVTGIAIPVGGYADTQLYAPSSSSHDVCMVSLSFGQASIVPMPFHFQVYAGVPSSGNPTLLYDSAVATGTNIKTGLASAQSTVYAAAAGGTNALWIRTYNAGTIAMTYAFQGVFLEFPGNGIVLPVYVPPAPYLGALLSTVHVGASEEFTEPQYGLQALADGGTMFIDDGHYFLPAAVCSTADAVASSGAFSAISGYTTAHPNNRFTNVSIIGNSPYGVVWDGLGGVGNGNRLAQGKGILLMHAPGLVKNINFISGGGADLTGDGECGLYSEAFVSPGTITVQNCAFDNCENGLLVPDVDFKDSSGTWHQNQGVGANVTIVINACDFGLSAPNGVTPDGLSHNFYVEGPSNTVTGCNLYTAAVGNTMKNRGPLISVSGCYVEGGAGRALDMPEGGSVTFTNTTLNVIAAANQQFLGYNDETTTRPWRVLSNPALTGCTLVAGRTSGNGASELWYNSSSGQFAFSNTTQQWVGSYPTLQPVRSQTSGTGTDTTACSGLFLTAAAGGTTLSTPPARPTSIAQPGYVPTPFTAWNGTV